MVERELRARRYRALGDVHRLTIVDELRLSDRTPTELLAATGLSSNLLAFHLDVLEEVGLVSRHGSQGDRRRRYVTLHDDVVGVTASAGRMELGEGPLLFVCTGNSARSQFAAALWEHCAGRGAVSAGAAPAAEVHPYAVEVGRRHGLDLSGARPCGYDEIDVVPELVVSVCDRAREAGLPFDVPMLHWSVPTPSTEEVAEFEEAFSQISRRVEQLAQATAA